MKLFLLFIGLLSLNGFSQNCTAAVDNSVFQQNYSQLALQLNDQNRLNFAINYTIDKCYSSDQLKVMAMLFENDTERLDFCTLSYPNIVDQDNIYDVYDAFQTFSHAFKFHDYVVAYNAGGIASKPPGTPLIVFPAYNYPAWLASNNSCGSPLSDKDFMVIANSINVFNTDEDKMTNAFVYFQSNCLSMAQAMKISSLIVVEDKKEIFLENVFQFISDKSNYTFATQCFSSQVIQDKWIDFCKNFLKPPCNVNENDFKQMLSKIDNANFATDQIPIVKALNSSYCFSTSQVKRIMDEFSFPENKLDVATILYKKCTDREKYYELKGEFTFPTYESEFQDLISGN
jgi:hypothetical protein